MNEIDDRTASRERRSRRLRFIAYSSYLALGLVGLVGAGVWVLDMAAPGMGELAGMWVGVIFIPLALAALLGVLVCTPLCWREKPLRVLAGLAALVGGAMCFDPAPGAIDKLLLAILGVVVVLFLVIPIRALRSMRAAGSDR